MTEEIFKELGFERVDVSAAEAEDERGFYYYTMDIGDICLMSNSDDEAEKEGWWCSIFDSFTFKIKGSGDLEALVNIIRNNTNG